MGIDYKELLKPYEGATPPANTASKRTPEGQKAWLLKRGIAEGIADDAMKTVYSELASGRVFTDNETLPAGYWLDRHLLETARELQGKSGPQRLGASQADLESVAAFSRMSLKIAFWKGAAVGSAITSATAVVLWLLIL